jgi:hypothetical protein
VEQLPRRRIAHNIALAAALALAVAGCSNRAQVFQDSNEGGWFSKPLELFKKPDWASNATVDVKDMGGSGPVGPDDLVGADGRCAPPVMAQAPAAPVATPAAAQPVAPAANSSVGSVAGELASEPAPAEPVPANLANVDPNGPPVLGGIALGMSECDAVRRAGMPGNVSITAGNKGQRLVMLTYLEGPWPGIYHFADGRLKEIDRAPAPPTPVKPPAKKKTVKKKKPAQKTSQREVEHAYIQ